MPRPPHSCPNCGAEIPRGTNACPECGSDEKTGWSDEAQYGGLNLPEDNFDYDDFVRREFGGEKPIPRVLHPFWWIVAVIVLAGFVWMLLRR